MHVFITSRTSYFFIRSRLEQYSEGQLVLSLHTLNHTVNNTSTLSVSPPPLTGKLSSIVHIKSNKVITPTFGKSMYPAGTGWWNVPEGVTIPVLSLSMAWCENTPGSDMGLWIMWLPIPLWHQSTLSNTTDNTEIALNHPFSRINVYTVPFIKVTFAQLTVFVHPPALKTEVHVDWRASETAPVLKSNTWARSYEQLHATKAPPLQFSFIWKGKMAFVLTSSSSKNLDSLPFWCCERGMYAMKAICSNSLEFFHEWTKRQKYFWKAKSENDQLEPCVHVLITGIH